MDFISILFQFYFNFILSFFLIILVYISDEFMLKFYMILRVTFLTTNY